MKKLKLCVYILIIVIVVVLFASYKIFLKNNDLTIYGIIKYADGIGRQPIDLINMLDGEDISINFIGRVASKKNLNAKVKSVLRNFNFKVGRILINEEPLDHFTKQEYKFDKHVYKFLAKINGLDRSEQIWLAYSMFESDKINPLWVFELNQKYDAVIVPDVSLVQIYQNSGVNIPIFVVPLSVDFNASLEQPLKQKAHPVFTFANFSSIENRKNTLKLIEAFKKAFPGRDDVRLLISARRAESQYRHDITDYIIEHNLTNVNYSIVEKDDKLYEEYFNQVDCYVSFSKGEGFSVQPREAMAKGIPVIVSDALAQKTIADSGLVKVVPARIARLAVYNDETLILGSNFDIEIDDAVAALQDVYNNYQKYLELGPQAREWAKQYSYKNIRPLYISLVKPKKVILGKKNKITKDYIETNSKKLYKKYINLTNDREIK